MVRKTKDEIPKTTAAQLGSLIKSARDIMRKDKGLNGDLDRLPMLTWIMFLKFLDDMERIERLKRNLQEGSIRLRLSHLIDGGIGLRKRTALQAMNLLRLSITMKL